MIYSKMATHTRWSRRIPSNPLKESSITFSRIGYKKDILANNNSSNYDLAILSYPKHMDFPKSIKKNTPFRIIVSSVNTALYSLASFLHKIISDSLEHTNSHTTNSFEIYNYLSGKTVRDTDVLLSLDVTALFTNVPLDLAIDGIRNRWVDIKQFTKIPKNEFLMAINFVLSSTYFTF